MGYIKTVVPMEDYRLFMEMESGSSVTVDFSVKLHTLIEAPFQYVVWGGGRLRLTVNKLMDVVLLG